MKKLNILVTGELRKREIMPAMDRIVLSESGTPPKTRSSQKQKAADASKTKRIKWKMCLQHLNHKVKSASE